jgi:mono/diheme cytochrome c family protein
MSKPFLLAGMGVCLLLSACGESEKSSRGFDYMPEMYHNPGYKSQGVIELGDEKARRQVPSMLQPVAGTVSRQGVGYQLDAKDFAGAKALVNPLAPTEEVLKIGQRNFNTYCAVCHGRDGDAANGYVAASKEHPNRFSGILSINTGNVALMTDGDIYHIISLGRNRMPDLAAQIPSAARWAVVLYVNALARSTQALQDAEKRLAELEKVTAPGAAKANDADAKADLIATKALIALRKKDLQLIQQGGDGDAFIPPAKPVPEYVKPTWATEK